METPASLTPSDSHRNRAFFPVLLALLVLLSLAQYLWNTHSKDAHSPGPAHHGDKRKARRGSRRGGGFRPPSSAVIGFQHTKWGHGSRYWGPALWPLPALSFHQLGPRLPQAPEAPVPSRLPQTAKWGRASGRGSLRGNRPPHLPIGSLTQNFQQLELGWVGLLKAGLHMMADVNLLDDTPTAGAHLQGVKKKGQSFCFSSYYKPVTKRWLFTLPHYHNLSLLLCHSKARAF